jgi:hypothetical protein
MGDLALYETGQAVTSRRSREERFVLMHYEIRLAGQLDKSSSAAVAGLNMTCSATVTVISGELDQAALHGMLERVRVLGLDLIEVRRVHATRHRA